jgi:hypothetical protein
MFLSLKAKVLVVLDSFLILLWLEKHNGVDIVKKHIGQFRIADKESVKGTEHLRGAYLR